MRNRIGVLCMLIGAALIGGALYLFLQNDQENRTAEEHVQHVMPLLYDVIEHAKEKTDSSESEAEESELLENTPKELLTPEDLIMTENVINGYAYIGYLEISDLDLVLPVMSNWDSRRLQIAPCRFTGSVRGEDLVIMAHNYMCHFGRLSKLSEGSEVVFTDMDGNIWRYEVVVMDILPAEAVEEMTSGEFDLTLFTCAPNRTHRVTVRCDKVEC